MPNVTTLMDKLRELEGGAQGDPICSALYDLGEVCQDLEGRVAELTDQQKDLQMRVQSLESRAI